MLRRYIEPLTIERPLKHLSPSAIAQCLTQPNTFYCTRLINNPIPREPQSLAMGVGTMFDILIKKLLIGKDIKCDMPVEQIESALQNEEIREESTLAAIQLMSAYRNSRLVTLTKWVQVEGEFYQDYTFTLDGITKTIKMMLKLDAVIWDEEFQMEIPLDWKCSGYTSAKGVSAKPKYMDKWDGKCWTGAHKDYYHNMPVTELPEDWARQFTLYGMAFNKLRGLPDWTEFPVVVHHPIFNGQFKKPMIAIYRAVATPEMQKKYWKEAGMVWDSLYDGTFFDRLCVPFGGALGKSLIASYANECESFFSNGQRSANELKLNF